MFVKVISIQRAQRFALNLKDNLFSLSNPNDTLTFYLTLQLSFGFALILTSFIRMDIPHKHNAEKPAFQILDPMDDQSSCILPDFNDSSQLSGDFSMDLAKSTEDSPRSQPVFRRKFRAWGLLGGYGHVIIENGVRKLQCTVGECSRVFSSKNSTTSTFNNHLVSFHGIKRPNPGNTVSASPASKSVTIKPKHHPVYLAKSIERCFLMDNIPLKVLNSLAFHQMLASACLAPSLESLVLPTIEELKAITMSNYHKYLPLVRGLLQRQSSISLTLGLLCNVGNESMLSVVAHFIDSDWVCQSIVIGMEHIDAIPTPSTVAETLLRVIANMEVSSKISSIVTEPTSFMLELGKVLTKESSTQEGFKFEAYQQVPCFAHVVARTCKAAILNGLGAPSLDFTKYEDVSKQRAVSSASRPTSILLNRIRISIMFLRTLAHSKVFEAQFANQPAPPLILDTSDRWDSTYRMLERFLAVRCQLNATLAACGNASLCFSTDEIRMAAQIAALLRLFAEISQAISADKKLTLAMAIYYFGILAEKLQPHPTEDAEFIKAAKAAALQELVKHFPQNRGNPLFICAMAMDPRHKLQYLEHPEKRGVSTIRSREILVGEWNRSYKQATVADLQPPTSLFAFNNAHFTQPSDELECYLGAPVLLCSDGSSNQEVLKYWHGQEKLLPNLCRMAKKYLAIPIRSDAAEDLLAPLKDPAPDPPASSEAKPVREQTLLKHWYSHFDLEE
ncbi:Zinc finger BED domain-containing protein 1 [Entomophthora muscae]|uniref:Zinc finger BED domain-containing protein 1 n=2 Tax=Entomophthora muscae TaxID=34485 RepID=A0ACC2UG80_9FUNG|nr:Zinc finger BED domain-containing protein 1 [Entomophthora muscae]